MLTQQFKIRIFFLCFIASALLLSAQSIPQRPKLVIGLVVDQMRWDFLFRFQKNYHPQGGINTLLNEGFSFHQTYIPYMPTITACGHATIYTGTTPSLHGIVGNNWYDKKMGKNITSVEDSINEASPRNLLSTTIGDALNMAQQHQGRLFSVSIKDRGAILPCGWSCNKAFWWDGNNKAFKSSSYYAYQPEWSKPITFKTMIDEWYQKGWVLAQSPERYEYLKKSIQDSVLYDLKAAIDKDYKRIIATPYGNILTLEFAQRIVREEGLGKNPKGATDMLTISLSTPDIIGHEYGPYSVEIEDTYLHLDKSLKNFITFLDREVGRQNYLLFLSADHGVSPIPEEAQKMQLPAGRIHSGKDQMNDYLKQKFNVTPLVLAFENDQVYLNHSLINSEKINMTMLYAEMEKYWSSQNEVLTAFACQDVHQKPIQESIKKSFLNGYYAPRSGDFQVIYKPYFIHGIKGTTHGSAHSYDAHIPLIWFGWRIPHGQSYTQASMIDIAPTISALLNIENTSASTGKVLEELLRE